jgi:hypothetical protein
MHVSNITTKKRMGITMQGMENNVVIFLLCALTYTVLVPWNNKYGVVRNIGLLLVLSICVNSTYYSSNGFLHGFYYFLMLCSFILGLRGLDKFKHHSQREWSILMFRSTTPPREVTEEKKTRV